MLSKPKQTDKKIKSRVSKSKRIKKNKDNNNLRNLFLGSIRFETDNLTPHAIEVLAKFITDHAHQSSLNKQNKK